MTAMVIKRTERERLRAIMRLIAYSVEEAHDLDAAFLKYTLETALAAAKEMINQGEDVEADGFSEEDSPPYLVDLTSRHLPL